MSKSNLHIPDTPSVNLTAHGLKIQCLLSSEERREPLSQTRSRQNFGTAALNHAPGPRYGWKVENWCMRFNSRFTNMREFHFCEEFFTSQEKRPRAPKEVRRAIAVPVLCLYIISSTRFPS